MVGTRKRQGIAESPSRHYSKTKHRKPPPQWGKTSPRERANLKDREKDVFDRLKVDWEAWNATMLPERARPANYVHPGNLTADRYGVVNPAPAAPSASPPTK